jgi:hypothetical protein
METRAAQQNFLNNKIFRLLSWILFGAGILLFAARLLSVPESGIDFRQDFQAARLLMAGNSIYAEVSPQNNHPPFVALLFLPMALLPYTAAVLLWSGISLALYLWSGSIVLRQLQIVLRTEWKAALVGAALAWYPFQGHIALGQISLLIVFLLIAAWAALRNRRNIVAGALVGLACLIKLFPGFILLYLMLHRKWEALVAAFVTLTAGGLLTWALVGSQDILAYFTQIAPSNAQDYYTFPINVSIAGGISRLFMEGPWVEPIIHSPTVTTILMVLSHGVIITLLAIFIRRSNQVNGGGDAGYAVTCIVMLLVSPITWAHIFPLLMLPLGIFLKNIQEKPSSGLQLMGILTFMLVSLPGLGTGYALMRYFEPDRIPWYAGLILLYPTVGLILTAVLTVISLPRRLRT